MKLFKLFIFAANSSYFTLISTFFHTVTKGYATQKTLHQDKKYIIFATKQKI